MGDCISIDGTHTSSPISPVAPTVARVDGGVRIAIAIVWVVPRGYSCIVVDSDSHIIPVLINVVLTPAVYGTDNIVEDMNG